MANWTGEAIQAGAGIATLGAEIGLTNWRNKKQREQQKKLTADQVEAQKELTRYNREQSLGMWQDTNYSAQRTEIEKAGLSVGMMYGGGGGGGTTANVPSGSVTGATAEVPRVNAGMAIEGAMAAAQIALTKAQTKNIEVDTAKKAGVDTEQVGAQTDLTKQNTANEAIKGEILQFEKQIKEIETKITTETQTDIIRNIRIANNKLAGEAEKARNEGSISTETYSQTVKQIEQTTVEQQLRISLIKAEIIKTGQETENLKMGINKIAEEIINMKGGRDIKWAEMGIEERELIVKQMLARNAETITEFNTNGTAHLKQLTSIITDILKAR